MLANIQAENVSIGGAPVNVLADLAGLGAAFPLGGYGVVGADADGALLRQRFRELGVDVAGLVGTERAITSYTDVMNEKGSGERMFFHHRGANALFGPEHVPVAALSCRIFHLGYLLLLDRMDEEDAEFGTVAARLLAAVRQRGILTSLDVVSEESDRFKTIVPPALRHVDYLILNEIEAGRVVGVDVRDPAGALDAEGVVRAVERLATLGDMRLIVVHMPEGVYARERSGRTYAVGSLELPPGFIRGAVGAGDAFCAGMLYGLHENWDCLRAARLGCCCAAASLSREGATEGVGRIAEVMELARRYPERRFAVPGGDSGRGGGRVAHG
jgi:sugar/nucleoside kinase (ribokinase family)